MSDGAPRRRPRTLPALAILFCVVAILIAGGLVIAGTWPQWSKAVLGTPVTTVYERQA